MAGAPRRPEEAAIQEAVFTRIGVRRIAEYAVEQAMSRCGRLVSATKSNGIIHTMPFWDEVVAEVAAGTPGLSVEKVLIDALAARLVLKPHSGDVIVASNLFGDSSPTLPPRWQAGSASRRAPS